MVGMQCWLNASEFHHVSKSELLTVRFLRQDKIRATLQEGHHGSNVHDGKNGVSLKVEARRSLEIAGETFRTEKKYGAEKYL